MVKMIISTDKDILEETALLCSPLTIDILEKFGWIGAEHNKSWDNVSSKIYSDSPYTCPKYKGWSIYTDINTFYILSPWKPDKPSTVNVVSTYGEILRIMNS